MIQKIINRIKLLPHKYLPLIIGYRLYPSPVTPLKSYKQTYGQEAIKKKKFYNIGAGQFKHSAWTNIDHTTKHYRNNSVHIQHDLMKARKIPLKDNSAELFYTSHTIEHINNKAAKKLFKEAKRCLKKGGYFRITCPNIELDYQAYLNKDNNYFKIKRKIKTSIEQGFLISFAGQFSKYHKHKGEKITDQAFKEIVTKNHFPIFLDKITKKININIQNKHPEDHINWWTHKKLIKMLKEAGFLKIYISGFGQSRVPVLRDTNYFDNTRPNISLYIEAIK